MSSLFQNIIIFGGVLLLLGLGYFLFIQDDQGTASGATSIQVAAESADFLRRLNELKAIDLNGDIFSDPRFISLIDYSTPVFSEPVGSSNPFATN